MRDRIRPILRDPRAQTAALLALFLLIPALATAADRRREGLLDRADRGDATLDVRAGVRAKGRGRAQRTAEVRLRRALGRRGVVEVDPATGTPRRVARSDGFLTGRRRGRASEIPLAYVKENLAAFGLDSNDLSGFAVAREYRSAQGLAHVELSQSARGLRAYDNGLSANVVGGRLVNVSGSPVKDLSVPSVRPRLGATEAVRRLLPRSRGASGASSSGGVRRQTRFREGHRAELAIFAGPKGNRLAWKVLALADSQHVFRAAVDAASGEVLQRSNLTKHLGLRAHEYYPSVDLDGVAGPDPAPAPELEAAPSGWVTAPFDSLKGNNAWTYSDVDDDVFYTVDLDGPDPGAADRVGPSSGSGTSSADWDYTLFSAPRDGSPPERTCPAGECTWNGFQEADGFPAGNNWQRNRAQNATQVHFFVNRFHDHLLAAPILFDQASGNFEEDDAPGPGVGSDPVHAQVDDGANTGATDLPPDPGFPDADHVNNASMITFPEGISPLMSMFLFTGAFGDGTHDVNGGDDAQVVYHEYVHGLTNRLVTTPDGFGALDGPQAGAMGEAWSDWYMFDYLEEKGFQPDTAASGELVQGEYENAPFVTAASDCAVGASVPRCPGNGYTYSDFARIIGFPEVHVDGEIWTQTLWQLRTRLIAKYARTNGITRARQLVTGGLRLSGPEPDFLDMRDSILQADTLNGSPDAQLIREVFAARGMGPCATTTGSADTNPRADFRVNVPAAGCSGAPAPPKPPPVTPPKLLSGIGFGGFPRRASLRRVLRRGLAGRISCDVGCSFRASLVLPRRSARRAGFRGRTVVVSRTRGSTATGGASRKVRFKFKRSLARRLRRLTRGTALELRVSASDSRGTRRIEKKGLRLSR